MNTPIMRTSEAHSLALNDSRSHRGKQQVKIRNSCDACQASKIKCGQEKPNCYRCATRGRHCRYSISKRRGRPRRNTDQNPATNTGQHQQPQLNNTAPSTVLHELHEIPFDGAAEGMITSPKIPPRNKTHAELLGEKSTSIWSRSTPSRTTADYQDELANFLTHPEDMQYEIQNDPTHPMANFWEPALTDLVGLSSVDSLNGVSPTCQGDRCLNQSLFPIEMINRSPAAVTPLYGLEIEDNDRSSVPVPSLTDTTTATTPDTTQKLPEVVSTYQDDQGLSMYISPEIRYPHCQNACYRAVMQNLLCVDQSLSDFSSSSLDSILRLESEVQKRTREVMSCPTCPTLRSTLLMLLLIIERIISLIEKKCNLEDTNSSQGQSIATRHKLGDHGRDITVKSWKQNRIGMQIMDECALYVDGFEVDYASKAKFVKTLIKMRLKRLSIALLEIRDLMSIDSADCNDRAAQIVAVDMQKRLPLLIGRVELWQENKSGNREKI
ncbi:hypothetical protein F5884DRAFT_832995 [Xylogone sp. PMI_703]|nr:hypothetical protein F5884DRAFT_832995 [Xylogone sp. PMI_703]